MYKSVEERLVYKAELSDRADSETPNEAPRRVCIYIGPDVHKRTISHCLKDGSGKIHAEGTIPPHLLIWTAG
jgi:hypothetical protein